MSTPAQDVKVPALGVIGAGAIWLVLWLGGASMSIVAMASGPTLPGQTPPVANLAIQIVCAAVSLVVILGGLRMLRLRSRGLAMTAAILSLVCGCLPLAIWAIVVLSRDDVRAAFDQGGAARSR